MKRRVVITGLGVVSSLGREKDSFFQALLEGKTGIKHDELLKESGCPIHISGKITDFNPLDYMDKREVGRADRFAQFALASSEIALADSGIDLNKLKSDRVGVYLGVGLGGIITLEEQYGRFLSDGFSRVSPFTVPMLIPNMASALISMKYGFKGPSLSTTTACAASLNAIGEAYKLVKDGSLDVVLSGGVEASITPFVISAFNSMKALSNRNDEPEKASRPFDRDRNGFVMGEGGGILILEELNHALKRGAIIYAEVKGYGTNSDSFHITAPHPEGEGAVGAMKLALVDAQIQPEEVDYINAHGTSTPLNDKIETLAIKRVFGEHAYNLKISSTKSMLGHLLGGAGAVESIATVMSIYKGVIHPTINYENKDPDCDLNYVPNKPWDSTKEGRSINIALKNAFGFGGHNAVVVYSKYW